MPLLCLVPFNDEPVPEGKGSSGICGSTEGEKGGRGGSEFPYSSSQLNNDRARVVSMWRTAASSTRIQMAPNTSLSSQLTSNSSLVLNSWADLTEYQSMIHNLISATTYMLLPPMFLRLAMEREENGGRHTHLFANVGCWPRHS